MAVKLGIKCKAYRNTGTWGTPVWSEIKCISDWALSVEWDKVEALTRESRVKFNVKTMLGLSWQGKFQKGSSGDSANAAALLAAIPTDAAPLDVMILDGPYATNGSAGYRCEVQVFSGSESQNPGDVLYPEISLMPTPPSVSGQIPASVLVSSGAPVFTDLAP